MARQAIYRRSIKAFGNIQFPEVQDKDPTGLLRLARSEEFEVADRARTTLMLFYVPLTCSIACRFSAKGRAGSEQELLGVALCAMVEAVDRNIADGTMTGQHFAKALHVRIIGALKNFMHSDYTIKPIDTKWFRKLKLKYGNEAFDVIAQAVKFEDLEDKSKIDLALASTKDQDRMNFDDLLHHRTLDEIERKVIIGTLEGRNDAEIAKDIGKCRSRIPQIRKGLRYKLSQIIEGTW